MSNTSLPNTSQHKLKLGEAKDDRTEIKGKTIEDIQLDKEHKSRFSLSDWLNVWICPVSISLLIVIHILTFVHIEGSTE